ncbi:MAG: DNA primase regulatory subunit PriL [Halobacteriota archaeon]
MDRSLARYPFLAAAREAVREEAPPIERLLGAEGPSAAVARGRERIERALTGETTGEPHDDPETELLSYPLARIVVSLVDDPLVTDRYVRAEARAAVTRLEEDRSAGRLDLDLEALFEDLDVAIRHRDARVDVDRVAYLRLAPAIDDDRWRLVNRPVADGWVAIDEAEVDELLAAAVRQRVGGDLPLEVPPAIEAELADAVDAVEARLGRPQLPEAFEAIDPDRFPPCMQALLDRVEAGDRLDPHARYALASFLTSVGLGPEDLGAVVEGAVPEALVEMAAAVTGEAGPTQFPPGSCATMQVYGVCVDRDELCERIGDPLTYYARRLAGEAP